MKTVSLGNGELTLFDSSDLSLPGSQEFTGLDLGGTFKGMTLGSDGRTQIVVMF
ncbi:MAG: hypothetical protein KME47_18220 [Nodosilinea sp. WJT8-NPBG4]|jgi:hypothetical protein|nr:hypothetical protein [Nodosilinea sp. WJT8-NPBG4]